MLLLRDVLDLEYAEIADMVEKSPADRRQIARRARGRAGDVLRSRPTNDVERRIIDRYIDTVADGEAERLAGIFADDVVLVADGGGKAAAVRRPLYGAERVAQPLVKVSWLRPEGSYFRVLRADGAISVMATVQDQVIALVSLEIVEERVVTVRAQLNPGQARANGDGLTGPARAHETAGPALGGAGPAGRGGGSKRY